MEDYNWTIFNGEIYITFKGKRIAKMLYSESDAEMVNKDEMVELTCKIKVSLNASKL